jgi:hypothetical protein
MNSNVISVLCLLSCFTSIGCRSHNVALITKHLPSKPKTQLRTRPVAQVNLLDQCPVARKLQDEGIEKFGEGKLIHAMLLFDKSVNLCQMEEKNAWETIYQIHVILGNKDKATQLQTKAASLLKKRLPEPDPQIYAPFFRILVASQWFTEAERFRASKQMHHYYLSLSKAVSVLEKETKRPITIESLPGNMHETIWSEDHRFFAYKSNAYVVDGRTGRALFHFPGKAFAFVPQKDVFVTKEIIKPKDESEESESFIYKGWSLRTGHLVFSYRAGLLLPSGSHGVGLEADPTSTMNDGSTPLMKDKKIVIEDFFSSRKLTIGPRFYQQKGASSLTNKESIKIANWFVSNDEKKIAVLFELESSCLLDVYNLRTGDMLFSNETTCNPHADLMISRNPQRVFSENSNYVVVEPPDNQQKGMVVGNLQTKKVTYVKYGAYAKAKNIEPDECRLDATYTFSPNGQTIVLGGGLQGDYRLCSVDLQTRKMVPWVPLVNREGRSFESILEPFLWISPPSVVMSGDRIFDIQRRNFVRTEYPIVPTAGTRSFFYDATIGKLGTFGTMKWQQKSPRIPEPVVLSTTSDWLLTTSKVDSQIDKLMITNWKTGKELWSFQEKENLRSFRFEAEDRFLLGEHHTWIDLSHLKHIRNVFPHSQPFSGREIELDEDKHTVRFPSEIKGMNYVWDFVNHHTVLEKARVSKPLAPGDTVWIQTPKEEKQYSLEFNTEIDKWELVAISGGDGRENIATFEKLSDPHSGILVHKHDGSYRLFGNKSSGVPGYLACFVGQIAIPDEMCADIFQKDGL